MKVEEISARELLEDCLGTKAGAADLIGVELEVELDDRGARLVGDRRLLAAAVNSLLDNALKRTRCGGRIVLGYRCDHNRGSIVVEDNGKGIPFNELCCIRDLFCRANLRGIDEVEEIDEELVGLTIVRDVADLHGGRVGVRSMEGEGSTYSFFLPRRTA